MSEVVQELRICKTDSELLDLLGERCLWVLRGGPYGHLGHAGSLKGALKKLLEFQVSRLGQWSIENESDHIVIEPAQVFRIVRHPMFSSLAHGHPVEPLV